MEDAEWIRSGQAIYSRDWINRAWRMERERGIFRRRILWRRRNGFLVILSAFSILDSGSEL